MIKPRLNKIFDQYIAAFDELNDAEHEEYFKWEAAAAFSAFDFSTSENFVLRLKALCKACSVVIDKANAYPFSCLCSCAAASEENAERVRQMFLSLFEDDGNDLSVRQLKIDAFINASEKLRADCGQTAYYGENGQTAVMGYLALRDPDNNYLLSTSMARELANRVGFADDWGTLNNFKLPVYTRFCDELVEAIRDYQPLLDINRTRFAPDFAGGKHIFHPDTNLHLLAFDIIHAAASSTYGLGDVVPVDPKLLEKQAAAQKAMDALAEAEQAVAEVGAAVEWLKQIAVPGRKVIHKIYGPGEIAEVSILNGNQARVKLSFTSKGTLPQTFELSTMLKNKLLKLSDDIPAEDVSKNLILLSRKAGLDNVLAQAQKTMEQYRDYIE